MVIYNILCCLEFRDMFLLDDEWPVMTPAIVKQIMLDMYGSSTSAIMRRIKKALRAHGYEYKLYFYFVKIVIISL